MGRPGRPAGSRPCEPVGFASSPVKRTIF
jgi:hypothetical protein